MAKYRIREVMKRGRKMWCLDIAATPDEPRKRIFKATKAEAQQEATDRFGEIDEFPEDLRNFTHDERRFLRRWLDKWPVSELEEMMQAAAKSKESPRTVKEAIEAYLSAPRERPLSDRHKEDLKIRLGQFQTEFGDQQLASVSTGKLEDYILGWQGSAPNHYRILRGLFYFALRREWVTKNPVKLIRRPVVITEDKGTLTPEQMTKALRVCAGIEPGIRFRTNKEPLTERYEPLLRLFVAGGLCGLRRAEIMKLDCAQVDSGRGEIHVMKMKTAARGIRERYVTVPANAKTWLQWLDLPSSGPFIGRTERNMRNRRNALVKAMNLKEWPHNVLRRSFGSYHLAAFQNAALTAEMMGHTDAETTKAKYRVARRKEVADAWFAVTPDILTPP